MTTQPPPVGGAVVQPLPGENDRGVPSVNAPRVRARWTRALVYGGLILGLPTAGVVGYFHATGSAPDPAAQQKSMPLTSSVPAKTFNLPAPVAPAQPLPVAAPTAAPAPAAA